MRVIVWVWVLGSSAAWASSPEDEPVVVAPNVTEIDFREVDVRAKVQRPSGTLVANPRRPVFHPLIRLREHFDDRIRDTASAL